MASETSGTICRRISKRDPTWTCPTGIRWLKWNLHPEPLADEVHYFRAFFRILEGETPYQGGYYYPPAFAFAGAYLIEIGGGWKSRTSRPNWLARSYWHQTETVRRFHGSCAAPAQFA